MQLTEKEKQIIADSEFLTLKLSVIDKIQKHFNNIQRSLRISIEESGFQFPINVDIINGKIFRGENYNYLPYVVLDYPKLFSKEDTFAFRTMFWWGNYFSAALHLEGKSLERYRSKIFQNVKLLLNNKTYICRNDTPWEYHYDKNNYVILTEKNTNILDNLDFIKLRTKFSLDDYSELPSLTGNFLKILIKVLTE